jgi:hypothetical protein
VPNITSEQIKEMKSVTERAMARVKNIKAATAEAMGTVIQTTEVGVAAFGMGVLRGRFGESLNLLGVPIDLGAGVLLHVLGFMGAAGKQYDEHLHNFGDGMLAAYLTVLGAGIGDSMSAAPKKTIKVGDDPYYVASGGQGYLPQGRSTVEGFAPGELQSILARA